MGRPSLAGLVLMASEDTEHAPQKLSLVEKLGYALGDSAANFVLQMRLAFSTIFFTDVFGIASESVAKLHIYSHIVDACNDLVWGTLSDRTQTRWGKFRPWIFWSAIPLGVTSYLVFAGPEFSANGKLIYAAITLNLMIIAYGANNIPYSALGGVISDDPTERLSVASWRMSFAMLAAMLVLAFTWDLRDFFGGEDQALGYRRTAALWAILAVTCSFATFFMTKERISTETLKDASLREELKALLANPAWKVFALAALLIYTCLGMRGSVSSYFLTYYLKRDDLFGEFNATGMVAAVVGIFISSPISDRLGKRNACCFGLFLTAFLVAGFYALPATTPWLTFVLQFVSQMAFGIVSPIMWSMIADIADLTEWQFNRRITAMTFAASLFFFKIGQGIGMWLTPYVLSRVGYQPKVEASEEVLHAVRMLLSIVPGCLFFAAGVVMLWYTISPQLERDMTAALRQKREAAG
jgi:GPH family glycoside/pentoside/hexuronide:cation symporter